MARAAKKKRDVPPLYMLVADGGRLAPAFQHDEERLMTFRKGTRLVVTVEPDGSRRGVRKWHAIIGRAVKNSLLPWLTASAADEGLRLALDMFEPKRANDGSWHRVTQSLSDLTDEELDEKIELMSALVYRLSGVDPEDFKKEMAGAGDERFASDYDRPAAANDAGSPTNLPDDSLPSPSGEDLADPSPLGEQSSSTGNPSQDDPQAGAAATNSDEATNPAITLEAEPDSAGDPASKSAAGAPISSESSGEEEKAAGEGYGAVSPPAAELSQADLDWLKLGAHWMLAALPDSDPEALRMLIVQVAEIRKVMPKDVSADARTRMETMRIHCRQVCDGKEKLSKTFMAAQAMTTPAEIEPKPFKTERSA